MGKLKKKWTEEELIPLFPSYECKSVLGVGFRVKLRSRIRKKCHETNKHYYKVIEMTYDYTPIPTVSMAIQSVIKQFVWLIVAEDRKAVVRHDEADEHGEVVWKECIRLWNISEGKRILFCEGDLRGSMNPLRKN